MITNAHDNNHAAFVRELLDTMTVDKATAQPTLNELSNKVRETIVRKSFADQVAFFSQFEMNWGIPT